MKGNCADGHDYIHEAIAQGASGIIMDADKESSLQKIDPAVRKTLLIIMVRNPHDAVIKLARAWRAQFDSQ